MTWKWWTSKDESNKECTRGIKETCHGEGQKISSVAEDVSGYIFLKIGRHKILNPCPQNAWQAAPYLVPKDFEVRFRTTIHMRPGKAATKVEQWPLPAIEAELNDFNGCAHFVSVDFCSS